jgi:hypothetical protein
LLSAACFPLPAVSDLLHAACILLSAACFLLSAVLRASHVRFLESDLLFGAQVLNRARQARITTEIFEIISGASAADEQK